MPKWIVNFGQVLLGVSEVIVMWMKSIIHSVALLDAMVRMHAKVASEMAKQLARGDRCLRGRGPLGKRQHSPGEQRGSEPLVVFIAIVQGLCLACPVLLTPGATQ